MFSRRNPSRTALLTAHWERPETLKDLLSPSGCEYHYSRALDVYRITGGGDVGVVSTENVLSPMSLYRLDHGDPPFMQSGGQT
jgi:hypothetical protein